MRLNLFKILIFVLFFSLIVQGRSATTPDDVLDDIQDEEKVETTQNVSGPALVTETIKKISPSKKIFILTNDGQSYSRGDFISLLSANQLVCRALVAKTSDNKIAGIKIIKIYSLNLWNQLSVGKEILVLKGDDSYYSKAKEIVADDKKAKDKGKKKDDDSKLQGEEDLFNSTSLSNSDDDQSMEESTKRLIKPDNLLALNYGLIQAKDSTGATVRYGHINGNWAYQLTDNVWGEIGLGTNTIRDYPNANGAGGLDTRLVSYTLKLKYTINAPFYSYVMPYVGYQIVTADSPGAGVYDASQPENSTVLAKEVQLVNDLKHSGPILGLCFLKRIVPGWFMRADLGSDIIGAGLSIEF